ncbi:MAG TPA: hypothetical protein VEL31_11230 [Ktedonobacteraceae bacterium]|nr:hypothetical protein [Ktedonobacteraceae bacterium]
MLDRRRNTITIGPLKLLFTPDGVEIQSDGLTARTRLTYTECYSLLEVLYQRREELYRLTHLEEQPSDGNPSQFLAEQRLTYVVDGPSLAVSSWESNPVEAGLASAGSPPLPDDPITDPS